MARLILFIYHLCASYFIWKKNRLVIPATRDTLLRTRVRLYIVTRFLYVDRGKNRGLDYESRYRSRLPFISILQPIIVIIGTSRYFPPLENITPYIVSTSRLSSNDLSIDLSDPLLTVFIEHCFIDQGVYNPDWLIAYSREICASDWKMFATSWLYCEK